MGLKHLDRGEKLLNEIKNPSPISLQTNPWTLLSIDLVTRIRFLIEFDNEETKNRSWKL